MVHRSSAFGKDHITSHSAAHTELAAVRYYKNSHATRTDATALYPLAFKRLIASYIASLRTATGEGRAETKVLLGLSHSRSLVSQQFGFKYPICTFFYQRYLLSASRFGGASSFQARADEYARGGRRDGDTKAQVRWYLYTHSLRFIRLYRSSYCLASFQSNNSSHIICRLSVHLPISCPLHSHHVAHYTFSARSSSRSR